MVLIQKSWKFVSTKKTKTKTNLHTDVYIRYTHNGQNLEAAKMSFSRYIQKMEYDWFSAKKKWHGGAVNANYYLKKANMKRLHTEWFQVCDILEKAKLKIVKDQQFLGAGKRDAILLKFFLKHLCKSYLLVIQSQLANWQVKWMFWI